jgi:hypothetical protein
MNSRNVLVFPLETAGKRQWRVASICLHDFFGIGVMFLLDNVYDLSYFLLWSNIIALFSLFTLPVKIAYCLSLRM